MGFGNGTLRTKPGFAPCHKRCGAVVQAAASGDCGPTCELSPGYGPARGASGVRTSALLSPFPAPHPGLRGGRAGDRCRQTRPFTLRSHLLPARLEGDEPGEHSGPTSSPRAAPTCAGLPAPPRKPRPKWAQPPPRMADRQRNAKVSRRCVGVSRGL